jgi:hypothetical protein
MAGRNEISTGIGLRHVRVALRDTDSIIALPSGWAHNAVYNGLQVGGALALTVTIPDPNRVQAQGDDRAYHTFNLPPTETPTGELRVSKTAMDVIALLTGTKVFGASPVRKIGLATDQQGLEPAIVLWGSRQAIDSDGDSAYFGNQIWQTYIFLNALAAPKPAAMEDQNVGEVTYAVSANDSAVDEQGVSFAVLTHGFTKAPYVMITTLGKFMLDAFTGDGSTADFTLSQATLHSGGQVVVAVNGVVKTVTTHYTVSGNVITFTGGNIPAHESKVIVEYEYD